MTTGCRTVRILKYQGSMTRRCTCRMERRPGAAAGGMATLTVSTTGYTVGKCAWRYQGACCIMTGCTDGGCMDFRTGLVWSSERITGLAAARAVVMTGRSAACSGTKYRGAVVYRGSRVDRRPVATVVTA
jgi:hypothetical protein